MNNELVEKDMKASVAYRSKIYGYRRINKKISAARVQRSDPKSYFWRQWTNIQRADVGCEQETRDKYTVNR